MWRTYCQLQRGRSGHLHHLVRRIALSARGRSHAREPLSIDEAWKAYQAKYVTPPPCADIFKCANAIAPVLVAGNADVAALLKCDRSAIGARIAPQVVCSGAQPTAADVIAAFNSLLPG